MAWCILYTLVAYQQLLALFPLAQGGAGQRGAQGSQGTDGAKGIQGTPGERGRQGSPGDRVCAAEVCA